MSLFDINKTKCHLEIILVLFPLIQNMYKLHSVLNTLLTALKPDKNEEFLKFVQIDLNSLFVLMKCVFDKTNRKELNEVADEELKHIHDWMNTVETNMKTLKSHIEYNNSLWFSYFEYDLMKDLKNICESKTNLQVHVENFISAMNL